MGTVGKGAAIGAFLGAVGLGVFSYLHGDIAWLTSALQRLPPDATGSTLIPALKYAAAGAVGGGVVGAIVGAIARHRANRSGVVPQ